MPENAHGSKTKEMTHLESFKRQLVCVFDDNLHTRMWHNIADWTIIGLIIISSLEVFLSTFDGISEQYGPILHFIDVFTTVVFSIEVSLRIWVADMLDPKYAGVKGRLRYCCSFYGVIDILSTYPALAGLFTAIPVTFTKIFRLARLMRIFRYMKSFRILGEAISSKKQELGISFAFLGILTVILSFLLYYAEHGAQPELCENGWQTLVWAFAKYLGDPGKIADFPLVTFWGHFIAAIVGLLGIAIFAVPAGLIGSGFVEVIEEKRHKEEVDGNIERLRHAFRWEKDQHATNLFLVPPFKPMETILTRQYLPENDVVEAVRNSTELHLYNLAKAFDIEDAESDRVVVVACPSNRPYGCCIDRGSKVTIVSTSGYDEPITGWVAYHIAKIGGFNYVSKEIEPNPDNPVSYYNIADETACPNLRSFLDDINAMSSRPGSWVIPMCFCSGPKSRQETVHLCYSPVKHDHGYDNPDRIFEDSATFDTFYNDLSTSLEDKFSLKTDKNDHYVVNKTDNILKHLDCTNGFALRIECREIYFPADRVARIKEIADCMNRSFEPGVEKQIPQEMKKRPAECFGYTGYED